MNYETITVRKLTPVIGAEIGGVDLSRPLPPYVFDEIHRALMENLVIFFRDQHLDHDQHKAFGRQFGPLHMHPASPPPPGHPEILIIHADANSTRVSGEEWHSDVSCDATPPMGSLLYLHTVPESGGDTMFANMYRAYETLSAPMRDMLGKLTAIHDGENAYRERYGRGDPARVFPRAEHPVVRTHPVTGRPALYVNRHFTTRIVQLHKSESDALLSYLFRHVETPEFTCRFQWRPHSLAFWDNRAAQHRALWDYFPAVRHGYRVTIQGDPPFYQGQSV
jgi:taurine dioxygenase